MPQKMKTHQPTRKALPMHRPPRHGIPGSSHAYGRRWRRLRRYVLSRQPLCADPFGHHAQEGWIEIATEVDHIIPRNGGGTDAIENLQGLCISCHSRKTARYDGGFGREPRANPGDSEARGERHEPRIARGSAGPVVKSGCQSSGMDR